MDVLLILSLACASVSFTVTTTSIFSPLRELVSKIHPKLEELIHCPWCLNHYIAAAALLTVSDDGWGKLLLYWFAIVGAGGILHYILLRAYKPVAKHMAQRQIDKLNKQ